MQDLRLFHDVAQLGSFSLTAKKHGVTQSAVSQRIRQFEIRLGVQLLDRSVRPFQLTPAGKLLNKEAASLISNYDDLLERVTDLEPDVAREIKVDAIYSAGIGPLQALAARFERETRVHVHFDFKRPEEVAESVREHRCDFGIVSYPTTWRLPWKPLRNERMSVVCSASHPLARRRRIKAKSLADWDIIGFEKDLPVGRAIRKYLREQGLSGEVRPKVDNIDTIKSLILDTEGIAILPSPTVRREVAAGLMSMIALEPVLERPMGLIHAPKTALSAPAQEFSDTLIRADGGSSDQSNRQRASQQLRAAK